MISPDDIIARIKYSGLMPENLSVAFFDDLQKHGECRTIAKGDMITYEDSPDAYIYFIVSGSCVRYVINPQGEERAVMFHTENFMPMVGNIYIGSRNSMVSYLLRSNENTRILRLSRAFGLKWVRQDVVFAQFVYTKAVEYLSELNRFQNHLLGLSSEDMLRWLMSNHSMIFQRFKNKDIANFMGVTPVWLSNLKRKLLTEV